MKKFLFIVSAWILASCNVGTTSYKYTNAQLLEACTEAIIQDGFSPPVASRINAYSFLAAYLAFEISDSLPNLSNKLLDFTWEDDILPINKTLYEAHIASTHAFNYVVKDMVYRDFIIDTILHTELQKMDLHDSRELEYSKKIGVLIGKNIIKYAKADGYVTTRNATYHPLKDTPGSWEPTPPNYGHALEPYWHTLRPFFLKDLTTYERSMSVPFSIEKNSDFHELVMAVYEASEEPSSNGISQAKHWDCNPLVTKSSGHFMEAIKQNNPVGHWLGITQILTEQENKTALEQLQITTYTALIMADAIKVCWHDKYRTNLIRPETYINKYIDASWRPLLETPQFPEYTSGHSVISMSAAVALSAFLGDSIPFVDNVNEKLGLPPRLFNSVYHAANDAAASRLVGGIHYMPAIEEGKLQGEAVSNTILQILNN